MERINSVPAENDLTVAANKSCIDKGGYNNFMVYGQIWKGMKLGCNVIYFHIFMLVKNLMATKLSVRFQFGGEKVNSGSKCVESGKWN